MQYFIITDTVNDNIYHEECPIEFKDGRKTYVAAYDSDSQTFISKSKITKNKELLSKIYENTIKNKIRKNEENNYISIRSTQKTIPVSAAFVINGRNKLFAALKVKPSEYYIVFITYDEILLIDKTKFTKKQIRETVTNIRNKMTSMYDKDESPILFQEILSYDGTKYIEK